MSHTPLSHTPLSHTHQCHIHQCHTHHCHTHHCHTHHCHTHHCHTHMEQIMMVGRDLTPADTDRHATADKFFLEFSSWLLKRSGNNLHFLDKVNLFLHKETICCLCAVSRCSVQHLRHEATSLRQLFESIIGMLLLARGLRYLRITC